MYCKIEGIALRPISVITGSYFETSLFKNHEIIARGQDEYLLSGYITRNRRVFGLGRERIIKLEKKDYDCLRQAPSPQSIEIDVTQNDRTILEVNNNVIYSQGLFQNELGLRVTNNKNQVIESQPLSHPYFYVDWPKRGMFKVDITDFLKSVQDKLVCKK